MFHYSDVIIASTLHEPVFRLKPLLNSCLPFIKENELKIIISCSRSTNEDVISYLKKNGFEASIPAKDKRVVSYLHALELSMDKIKDHVNQRILYVDFDRLIHWIHNYPKEFLEILERSTSIDLLHIGRNPRAFKTHPETQQYTERIVNQLGSKVLGFSEPRDLISVCYSFTKELCEHLLKRSYPTTMGFYISWPVVLWKNAKSSEYIEVDGQEWETPDRFESEIKDLGYQKWMEQFQSVKEWRLRVLLLEECAMELSEFI